ncbi:hypothetical protein SNEBB_007058, partial [Seison nebaliae]
MSHDEVYEFMKKRHPHANKSMMKTIYRRFIDYFDHNGFNKRDGAKIFSSICNVNLTEIDKYRSVGGEIFLAILNVFRIRKGEINRNNVHFLYQETVNFIFEKKSLIAVWLIDLLVNNNSMYLIPVAAAEIIFIIEQKDDVHAALNNLQTKENILNRFISIVNCSKICDIILGPSKMEKNKESTKISQYDTFDDVIEDFFSSHQYNVDDSSPVLDSVVDMMFTTTNMELTKKYGIYVFNQIMESIELKIGAYLPMVYSSFFQNNDIGGFKYNDTLNDFDDWFPSYVGKLKLVRDFFCTPWICGHLRLNCNNYYHFANRKESGRFSSFHYYVMLLATYEDCSDDKRVKFVLRADKIRYTLRYITNDSSFLSQNLSKIVDYNKLETIIEEFENNVLIHRIGCLKSIRLIKTLIRMNPKGKSSEDDYNMILRLLPKFGTCIDYHSNERINEKFKYDDDIVEEVKVKEISIKNNSSVNGLIETDDIGTQTQISDSSTNLFSREENDKEQNLNKKFINCSIGTDIRMLEYQFETGVKTECDDNEIGIQTQSVEVSNKKKECGDMIEKFMKYHKTYPNSSLTEKKNEVAKHQMFSDKIELENFN